MQRLMCKSKIHRATVTGAELDYDGSITLDPVLLEAADIFSYEQVQVVNLNNGSRFETYTMPGEPGSGAVVLNGPAARLVQPGDLVIVISYALYTEQELMNHQPRVVHVDRANQIRNGAPAATRPPLGIPPA